VCLLSANLRRRSWRDLVTVVDIEIDGASEQRLRDYLDGIGDILGTPQRRANFARYAFGLIGDGDRKSMEPIVARAGASVSHMDAAHQRMQEFITNSGWDDHAVRLAAARHALEPMTKTAVAWAWIVDDTGFLKQGKHSVGVQRQYTGSAGKVTNCQIGVSLSIATPQDHVAVDFELYLPTCWANDAARRAEARIPDDVVFKTKPQLALAMLRRAVKAKLPRGTVLADEGYGGSPEFREGCRKLGLDFAVTVPSTTRVWTVDALGRRSGDPLEARRLAQGLAAAGAFRKYTWREGTAAPLHARFAFVRVVPAADDGREPRRRDRVWLVCEWRDGDDAPCHFHLATYKRMPFVQLVQLIKERWRTERVYQDMKGELGLDHFEGRRFRGWHHHVSVALACYAFLVAERARRFPPSGDTAQEHHPIAIAA
jgi:SRSO17 transposase